MDGVSYTDLSDQFVQGGGVFDTMKFNGLSRLQLNWNGRVISHFQARIILPTDKTKSPTWWEFQIVRHLAGGNVDPTADETKSVAPKANQAILYTVEMDIDPGTPLSIIFRHNGSDPVRFVKRIWKLNPYVQDVRYA